MRRLLKALAASSLVALIGHPALSGEMELLGVGTAPAGGAFLPTTATLFGITNNSLGTSDLTPADGFWTGVSNGTAAPTVTQVSDTLPDGTTGTVSRAVFPAVPAGTTNISILNQPTTSTNIVNSKTMTFGVWAKVTSGTGPAWVAWSAAGGVGGFPGRTLIPTDGAWHEITASIPPGTFIASQAPAPQIGVNQFDAGQQAGSVATTIELAGNFMVDGKTAPLINFTDVNGPLKNTTSSFRTAVLTKSLPAHVRWRDPTQIIPISGNPYISELGSEPWRSGGVSAPYVQTQFQSGGFYWAMSNCTSATNHVGWLSFCLWKSADGVTGWTEDLTNAPTVKAFGSAADYSTEGTGSGASWWDLKPAFLPYGCNVAGTPHNFCILYSAKSQPSNNDNTYMAWSDTINGVYTMFGCTSTPTCTGQTPVNLAGSPLGYAEPGLVSIVNVGGITGTNYIYTVSNGADDGPWTVIWTTPANPATSTAGNTLTYDTLGLPPLVNGADWEYADSHTQYADNFVFPNPCGFYEWYYTAVSTGTTAPFSSSVQQIVGVAISPNPDGPWYKLNQPFIPTNSSMYFGAKYIGDSVAMISGSTFTWSGNFDDGTSTSRAVMAQGPAGVCP